jgi:methylated-DNA-[protein]-cysteine S-methyltransferase
MRSPGVSEPALDVVVPLGPVRLGARFDGDWLVATQFIYDDTPLRPAESPPARELVRQLRAYLEEPGFRFDLPLRPSGTTFQRRVWRALLGIVPGRVLTYGGLAAELGSAARAVGGACRANDIPLVIPCHRVVARGGLGGFSGETTGTRLDLKRWLLRHEGAI